MYQNKRLITGGIAIILLLVGTILFFPETPEDPCNAIDPPNISITNSKGDDLYRTGNLKINDSEYIEIKYIDEVDKSHLLVPVETVNISVDIFSSGDTHIRHNINISETIIINTSGVFKNNEYIHFMKLNDIDRVVIRANPKYTDFEFRQNKNCLINVLEK